MNWARVISPGPFEAFQLEHWERDGWEVRAFLGPCPTVDPKTGQPTGAAYVVYLRRSPLAPPPTRPPGLPFPQGPLGASS